MLFLFKSTPENKKRKHSEHFLHHQEPLGSQRADRTYCIRVVGCSQVSLHYWWSLNSPHDSVIGYPILSLFTFNDEYLFISYTCFCLFFSKLWALLATVLGKVSKFYGGLLYAILVMQSLKYIICNFQEWARIARSSCALLIIPTVLYSTHTPRLCL